VEAVPLSFFAQETANRAHRAKLAKGSARSRVFMMVTSVLMIGLNAARDAARKQRGRVTASGGNLAGLLQGIATRYASDVPFSVSE
jgi:hypothetical protein